MSGLLKATWHFVVAAFDSLFWPVPKIDAEALKQKQIEAINRELAEAGHPLRIAHWKTEERR